MVGRKSKRPYYYSTIQRKNGPPKKQKLKKRVADFGTVIF